MYQIPIPDDLRRSGMDQRFKITVTLAYTSIPRRTRRTYRYYNSVWLDWTASRKGESFRSFEQEALLHDQNEILRDGTNELSWFIGHRTDQGEVSGLRRQNGSVQKDWTEIAAYELPSDLCIAIRGHQGWDTNPESTASYALAVTIESVNNEIPIYNRIAQSISQIRSRIQI
ncbi:Peptidase, S8/S53 family [Leptospira borgpetersenii str. 4E]|nr:Peptidase, S8/S53 family [Leptospira borgpetersenii str. 4E]